MRFKRGKSASKERKAGQVFGCRGKNRLSKKCGDFLMPEVLFDEAVLYGFVGDFEAEVGEVFFLGKFGAEGEDFLFIIRFVAAEEVFAFGFDDENAVKIDGVVPGIGGGDEVGIDFIFAPALNGIFSSRIISIPKIEFALVFEIPSNLFFQFIKFVFGYEVEKRFSQRLVV